MASGDCKISIGALTWDFSEFTPDMTWSISKNIEYFRFPGSSDKIILDLLDNEETLNLSLKISTSDPTAQLNTGSSAGASLRSFMTTLRDTGSDPSDSSSLTTALWHTFGTYTIGIRGAQLHQASGENNLYTLDVQFLIQSGPV